MTHVVAGALLGLAGSVHCLAMCGPLAGVMASSPGRRLSVAMWYHAGRIAIYVLLGVAAGLAGHAAGTGGLGRGLAIAAGAVMVLVAVGHPRALRFVPTRWLTSALSKTMERLTRARARHPRFAAIGAGAANGLLPCGLVYAAALAAAASGNVVSATMSMLAFGAGTLPMMTAVWLSSSFVSVRVRRRLSFATPVAIAIVGLLLIGRGLGVTEHGIQASVDVAPVTGSAHMH